MSAAAPDSSAPALGLSASAPLRGALRPPASKSLALRELVASGLAAGRSRLSGLSPAEDVRAGIDVLAALGLCARAPAESELAIEGRPPVLGGWRASAPLEVRESGALARFATAAFGLCGAPDGEGLVRGTGTLARRRSPALFACLRACGVGLAGASDGWPVRIAPLGPPSDLELHAPSSSQEISALLLALAAYPGENRLHVTGTMPSAPYVELTRAVLAARQVSVELERGPRALIWHVRGPIAPAERAIEPDASAAAVALAAACLSGGQLRVPGLGSASAQGDVRIAEHLRAFGCEAELGARELSAGGRPRRGAQLELGGEPDLAPVLAAVAAAAALDPAVRGASRLGGLATLRGKESDRLEGLAQALAALGLDVRVEGDALCLAPGAGAAPEAGPLVLDPRGDHRMAFCFALLGLARERVYTRSPQCVAKSWPSFWSDMAALGARVAVHEPDARARA